MCAPPGVQCSADRQRLYAHRTLLYAREIAAGMALRLQAGSALPPDIRQKPEAVIYAMLTAWSSPETIALEITGADTARMDGHGLVQRVNFDLVVTDTGNLLRDIIGSMTCDQVGRFLIFVRGTARIGADNVGIKILRSAMLSAGRPTPPSSLSSSSDISEMVNCMRVLPRALTCVGMLMVPDWCTIASLLRKTLKMGGGGGDAIQANRILALYSKENLRAFVIEQIETAISGGSTIFEDVHVFQ